MMDSPNKKKPKNIQNLKEEVTRHWYEDGTVEISFGITYMLLGSMILFYRMTPLRLLYTVIWILIYGMIAFIGGILLPRKLKAKLVWSKIGYSITKESYPKLYWVFLGLSILTAAFAVFSIVFLSSEITIFSFGCVLFFGYISQFFQTWRIKRFLYVSFVPLFAAGICVILGLFWKQSIAIMFLATGCVSLIFGSIVYMKFSRKEV